MEHRQESNDGVHEQDADMNNDDKEKQSLTGGKSHVTVSKNRETEDDADRSSIATHHSKPQHAKVSKFWDHVNGGELSSTEVLKARRLDVEYLNKVKVVERVPYSFVKHRTGKEPIKVKWADTLKTNGIHGSRLVAKECRRGSKIDVFTNFSETPPREFANLMISMVATAQWDQAAWFGQEGHENSSEIVMMHTDIL